MGNFFSGLDDRVHYYQFYCYNIMMMMIMMIITIDVVSLQPSLVWTM